MISLIKRSGWKVQSNEQGSDRQQRVGRGRSNVVHMVPGFIPECTLQRPAPRMMQSGARPNSSVMVSRTTRAPSLISRAGTSAGFICRDGFILSGDWRAEGETLVPTVIFNLVSLQRGRRPQTPAMDSHRRRESVGQTGNIVQMKPPPLHLHRIHFVSRLSWTGLWRSSWNYICLLITFCFSALSHVWKKSNSTHSYEENKKQSVSAGKTQCSGPEICHTVSHVRSVLSSSLFTKHTDSTYLF